MKKIVHVMIGAFLLALGLAVTSCGVYAVEGQAGKKAILVVSFGTTFADTRKVATETVENKIRAAFPDYEVRRAFTSRIIIQRLAERDGIKVDTEKQALERLRADGYTEVIIQLINHCRQEPPEN
jgi:sirohydrochlorin cobaltochelatase